VPPPLRVGLDPVLHLHSHSHSSGFSLKYGSHPQLSFWAPVAASGRAPLISHIPNGALTAARLPRLLPSPSPTGEVGLETTSATGGEGGGGEARGAPSDTSPVSEQSLPPLPPRRHCPCPASLMDSIWTSSPDPG
jgi:hypothetical protein